MSTDVANLQVRGCVESDETNRSNATKPPNG